MHSRQFLIHLQTLFHGLRLAVSFMTIVPVGKPDFAQQKALSASILWYPFIGCLSGAIAWSVFSFLPTPDYLNAGLIVCAWLLLTGALHIDGLADSADALIGGIGDPERTRQILADSRNGAMAIAAVVAVLMLKCLAVLTVLEAEALAALVSIPVIARIALLGFVTSYPYAGSGFMSSAFASTSRPTVALVIFGWLLILMLLLSFEELLIAASTALLLLLFVGSLCVRRLGGFTGDVAGAFVELAECLLLLAFALVVSA